MAQYDENDDIYFVHVDELHCRSKVENFANRVVSETYNRFGYDLQRRIETIRCGKFAEEAFCFCMYDMFGYRIEDVNYDIYDGVENGDEEDFVINGYDIDIKSSKDTDHRGSIACINSFNFPVPTDQHIKDITVSIIYNDDGWYAISRWIDKRTYENECRIGSLPVNNGITRQFYKLPLKRGYGISTLGRFLGI